MESRAKFLGHPVHQQLIAFPLGLLTTAAGFDLVAAVTRHSSWTNMAFYLIGPGMITGWIAAVFGLLDWIEIPRRTRARRIGAVHGLGNTVVLLLFVASFFLRWPDPTAAPPLAYAFSYGATLLALLTAWMGAELVDRLGVGVDDGANVDAPNSLRHSRAA